jgi:hypothetical protein
MDWNGTASLNYSTARANMKTYTVWVVYDKDGKDGHSEGIEVQAETMARAVTRLLDYQDLIGKDLPKEFEIHLSATLDNNSDVFTDDDRTYLRECKFAF